MPDENPADVIEQAARVVFDYKPAAPMVIARALHDAGLLADPADRDGQRNLQWNVLVARAERAEADYVAADRHARLMRTELQEKRLENAELRAKVAAAERTAERWESLQTAAYWPKQAARELRHALSLPKVYPAALDGAGDAPNQIGGGSDE